MNALQESFPKIENGLHKTGLEGVGIFQETKPMPRKPMLYTPGLCIMVQGHKIGYLGDQTFRYDANHYLVTSVTMPFECETFASPEDPLRGLFICIDMGQLRDLIGRMNLQPMPSRSERKLPLGIGPAMMSPDMQDATIRLLRCLHSDTDAQILGPGLLREVLYRALQGDQSEALFSLAMHSGSFSQVAHALNVMQNNYKQKLDVDQLASTANLSVSAFHRAFKEVTSDSPIQYLKKLRLSKARDLMINDRMKAYIAADEVGYESASQFSREFKRYFGESPADMMRELKAS